uniref:RNA exonuclease 1 homolog-like domain-containing protein n=1 Tax=Neolamprologus brichardi TaxID=32507 RepID=A0A3Q4I8K0_NEOBR
MFPSSGFFADINCPFSQHGRCERPHCLYKHPTKQARDWFAVSFESSKVDFTGQPYTGCGDDCLHELERINKEIESVRHEVEQERMRLSRYQTVQADRINNTPASKRESGSKTIDRKTYGPSSRTDFTKAHQRGKKYVVDNSKPRTDLEYDPLSNFSADLLSFSSLTKDQKLKSRQVKDKSLENTAPSKSRPQPQVLVPLCEPITSGFGSRPSVSSKTQQVQQRASTLTASVKGGQAFASSTSQKKPETQFTPSVLTQNPATLQPVRNGKYLLPLPAKRKLKQQCEAAKDKVPHDVRQRYVNMFTEEFLKTTPNVNDAFEKALAEEKTVYNRSVNKLKYMSVAVNALKRLKSQSTVAAKGEHFMEKAVGNYLFVKYLQNLCRSDDMALYESLKDYILTDEKLIERNYPVQHPEKCGSAVLFAEKKVNADGKWKYPTMLPGIPILFH